LFTIAVDDSGIERIDSPVLCDAENLGNFIGWHTTRLVSNTVLEAKLDSAKG
jgi:hypothetical protein